MNEQQTETTSNNELTDDAPALYVGTYAKYNDGSIEGAWLSLEGHDRESFLAACFDLHADEHDPELMFQDYQNLPRELYNESFLNPVIFDWLELDESDREIVLMHTEATGEKITPESIQAAQDAYVGQYDSLSDFVDEQLEQCEEYHALPSWIRFAIDNDTAWNCSLRHDYIEEYNPRTRTHYIFTR